MELNKRRKLIRKRTEANKNKTKANKKKENMVDENNDLVSFLELASSDKIYVNGLNLNETKNEILLDYKGDFELNELMVIGPVVHKTIIRFQNMDDFETYFNAIDVDYDSEDVTFTG